MTTCSFKNLTLKCASISLLALSLLPAMHVLALPASGETNLVPGKFKTIQETIDHSKPGDIVLVASQGPTRNAFGSGKALLCAVPVTTPRANSASSGPRSPYSIIPMAKAPE